MPICSARRRPATPRSPASVHLSRSSNADHCDIVRSFLYDHIDRVFASLVHGCRFECVYGTSSRCALIMVELAVLCDTGHLFVSPRRNSRGTPRALRDGGGLLRGGARGGRWRGRRTVRETHELRASAPSGGAVESPRVGGRFAGVSRSATTSNTRASSSQVVTTGVSTCVRCGAVCSC